MLKDLSAWRGWECRPLPADGAEVWGLDGSPPPGLCTFSGEAGCLEALFCRRGGLLLELPDGRRLEMKAGQALLLPGRMGACCCRFLPEKFQGIIVQENERAALTSLCAIWPSLARRLPEKEPACAVMELALWCEALFAALDRFPAEWQGNYCAVKAMELLCLLCAGEDGEPQPSAAYFDRCQCQTVREVHDYMLEHMDQTLTIRRMAQQFHLSETFLKACFRQLYGAPIHQYIMERRMARAARLLCATSQTVLQVAMAVGYGSVSQFGAVFKARYQMTPSQFRKKAKKMSVTVCSGPNQEEKPES